MTNMAHYGFTHIFTDRNGQISSYHLLATGYFAEKVSFYAEAELLENWPGRDMLDIYKILFTHQSTSDILCTIHS